MPILLQLELHIVVSAAEIIIGMQRAISCRAAAALSIFKALLLNC